MIVRAINKTTGGMWLSVLLLVALFLRVLLVVASGDAVHQDGGEYFMLSEQIYRHLAALDFEALFRTPISGHWGALLFGAIPFFLQTDLLRPEEVSGVFFVLPQVVNVFLLYRIAIALGFGSKAGLIAAFLYAFSFSTIYQSRHVLPHDLSLMFFLLALLLVAKKGTNHLMVVFAAGVLAFFTMFVYYGYWEASGIALLFASGFRVNTPGRLIMNGLAAASGFALPVVVFYGCGYWFGVDLADQFFHFSRSIQFGEFSEGYSLPFAFFYHAEGLLLFVWLGCVLAGMAMKPRIYEVQCLLFGIVMMYLMMVVTSNLMEYFVMYGRLARQLSPLLCLLAAVILVRLYSAWLAALLIAVTLGFAVNYHALFYAVFDSEAANIRARLLANLRPDNHELVDVMVCVPDVNVEMCGRPRADCEVRYTWLPHANFKFFQYDGMKPADRARIAGFTVYIKFLDCPRAPSG